MAQTLQRLAIPRLAYTSSGKPIESPRREPTILIPENMTIVFATEQSDLLLCLESNVGTRRNALFI